MSDHKEITVTASTTSNSINNNNPYVYISSGPLSSAPSKRLNPMDTIYGVLSHYGKKVEEATRQAENMADSIWNHLKVSSRPVNTAMAKLIQGTKVLASGGPEKVFQQTFGVFPGEKLLQPYACYVTTDSEPVIGTLYISTKRLAFCSEYPLCNHPFSLQHQCVYYKVVVQLEQLSTVNRTTNRLNPTEKQIQVVTMDGYEFNFMGFLSCDKALQTINEARQQRGNGSSVYSVTSSFGLKP
ncbi:hypothetical protein VNO77_28153 [Canavalia gladiata]|uniref:GRAM domain-containing protein n=1 Tax=Canavalia gladiata TaxID=3824 RepID=A0AAN9Q739_CANGL